MVREEETGWKPVWKRCPEKCTQQTRDAEIRRIQDLREREAAAASAQAAPPSAAVPDPEAAPPRHPAAPRRPAPYRGKPTPARGTTPTARPSTPATAAPPRRWPAVALDIGPEGWLLDIPQFPAPAGTKLTDWFAWLGTGLPVRVDRVHDAGRNGDGIICLSASALKALSLPAGLPVTDKSRAQLYKKLATAAASVGMELSEEVGPTMHAFRRKGAPGGPKTSVRIVFTPWLGQGSEKQKATNDQAARLASLAGQPDAAALARRTRAYVAMIGVAPGSTPATTGMLLLDAVRPREHWVQDDETGEWSSQLRDGALPSGDICVPPAAGSRHPLTRDLQQRNEAVCQEEDFKFWARPLTEDEKAMPYAVVVDTCASYMAVTESLRLPAGPLKHHTNAAWDSKVAGLWWCDFSQVAVEEELPHPATFDGQPPQGPGWYATPTVAYMITEYGYNPDEITEGYLSTHTVPLLKEWTGRVRSSYKQAYTDLGLCDGQDPQEFLDAYAVHKQTGDAPDAADALVLATLIKELYKGGIGKWADSARKSIDDDDVWLKKVVASWHYRPELRFHIIAAARIAGHRRVRKTFKLTGRVPFAMNVDASFYAALEPSPLELLAFTEAGKPVPGTLRLGIAPGSSKHEASIPMDAVIEAMDGGDHPSRLTHHYRTDGQPVDDDSQTSPKEVG
ncbi:hypothetical protein ABZV92_18640 [Streptomyces rubiginosohelvolus]|uniref:hypothetical protein n=1 Tax=Streptomyces rubiginosohelvolus TaxID=67362 RepID=UPI0033ACEB6A